MDDSAPAVPSASPPSAAHVLERVILHGDLSSLSGTDKVIYYRNVCESLGLNPLTQPDRQITSRRKFFAPKIESMSTLR